MKSVISGFVKLTIPGLGRWSIPLVVAIVVLAVLPQVGMPRAWITYLFQFFMILTVANIWSLHAGRSGMITLCLAAFLGLGGYTMTIGSYFGIPIPLGIILGAIIAAVFAFLVFFPVYRLKGVYFAIGTLVLPQIMQYVFLIWDPVGNPLTGGGAGYTVRGGMLFSRIDVYWMALAVAALSMIVILVVSNSKLGLGLAAIRDNDNAAASSGVDVFRLKLYSFVIGAFVVGLAGGVITLRSQYIQPITAFNIGWQMTAILAAVIGGLRIRGGPIVGAIILTFLHFWLAGFPGYSMLVQGAILIIIMLAIPQGIVGAIGRIRGTRVQRATLRLATTIADRIKRKGNR
ncbi:branched-chain amino acid ABC transporter permease [Chloroflexota bacterium]